MYSPSRSGSRDSFADDGAFNLPSPEHEAFADLNGENEDSMGVASQASIYDSYSQQFQIGPSPSSAPRKKRSRMLRTDTPSDRRRWFVDTCACRRRPQGMLERIKRGGIATVLNVDDEYHLLVQSATLWRLARELTRRTLGVAGASQLRSDCDHIMARLRFAYETCTQIRSTRSTGGATACSAAASWRRVSDGSASACRRASSTR